MLYDALLSKIFNFKVLCLYAIDLLGTLSMPKDKNQTMQALRREWCNAKISVFEISNFNDELKLRA